VGSIPTRLTKSLSSKHLVDFPRCSEGSHDPQICENHPPPFSR
jgi:hypothetical protein